MTIGGEMEDCTNVVINTADILEKRKGLVRGLQEQFNGVVCGLFKYTDHCGVERIIVADESGISIRQPFALPTFTIADCYPFDAFDGADGDPLDSEKWRNAGDYEQRGDLLVPVVGAAALASAADDLLPAESARWFKGSCSRSYRVRITYAFQDITIRQRVWVVIRGNGDLSDSSLVLGVVDFEAGGVIHEARLVYASSSHVFTLQGKVSLSGSPAGTLEVRYDQTQRKGSLVVDPDGGSPATINGAVLNPIQDVDLGLVSAIGARHIGGVQPDATFGILVVDGGLLGG